jgi:phage baseplate assembly protein W
MQVVERNTIKSIIQNINIILTTPKGSDPHRPLFGSNLWQFIDQPLTVITRGRIKAEIIEAIETWEPRVEIEEVYLQRDYSSLRIIIKYKIKETETIQTQEITL